MGLINVAFGNDAGEFELGGAKAGDAAAMELRLNQVLASAVDPELVGDFYLTGVQEGPEWEGCFVFSLAGPMAVPRTDLAAVAVVAGDVVAARRLLLDRLVAVNSEAPFDYVAKVEIAGGGDGTALMLVAIIFRAPE